MIPKHNILLNFYQLNTKGSWNPTLRFKILYFMVIISQIKDRFLIYYPKFKYHFYFSDVEKSILDYFPSEG